MANKPYTSEEVASLVHRWQGVRFAIKETDKTIISISNTDLYRHGSETRCNPEILEKIKAALTRAYNQGIREVTMYSPYKTRVELSDLALSITDDPEWQVFPYEEATYLKNVTEIQQRIWSKELFYAEMDAHMAMMQKRYCDSIGLTDDVLDELMQYMDVKNVNELPPHLRRFFETNQEQPTPASQQEHEQKP